MSWEPIETAPKDGTIVDLFVANGEFPQRWTDCFWGKPMHCCGEDGDHCDSDWHYSEPGWVTDFNEFMLDTPTHWMPIPPPPTP